MITDRTETPQPSKDQEKPKPKVHRVRMTSFSSGPGKGSVIHYISREDEAALRRDAEEKAKKESQKK